MLNRDSDPIRELRGSAQTPVAFIRAIVTGYQRYGADPAKALEHAGIASRLLEDPRNRVTAEQMERCSGFAMQELDDEALGWFSRRLPWGSYGLLCRASLTAPDLGVALKRWCRHHRLLTEDVRFSLSVMDGCACLRLEEARPLGNLREFCLVSLLRYTLGFACWVVDSRLVLTSVDFPFAEPDHAAVYPRLFAGPISFNPGAHATELRFDAAYLDLALQRDEPELRSMLMRALPLTVRQYRRDRLLGEQVRQCLRADGGLGLTAGQLATRLNMAVRTLHRQLAVEGTPLQSLKDTARRDRAQGLLARTQRPVKQIAMLAGFRNEKSFARAFRAWTGESPGAWRRRHAAPES